MARKLYTKERFGSRELAYLPYTYIITQKQQKVKFLHEIHLKKIDKNKKIESLAAILETLKNTNGGHIYG